MRIYLCEDDTNFPFSIMLEMVTNGTATTLNLQVVMCQFYIITEFFFNIFLITGIGRGDQGKI